MTIQQSLNPDEGKQQEEVTFSIGDLAREFKVTLRSIRFYEDQGLLHPRREGLTRIFSRRDRGRLALICRGKRLGFSLKEIKKFLDLYESEDRQNQQMRYLLEKARERVKVLEQQRIDIDQTLEELKNIQKEITDTLGAKG